MGRKRKRGAKEAANPGPRQAKRAKGEASAPGAAPGAAPQAAAVPSLKPAPFVEAPDADEKRREAQIYELLGSEDEAERLQAAKCIVSSLFGDEPVPEAVLERHIGRRLFRGLASGRNASRLGFSLVITEILSQLLGEESSLGSRYPGLTFDAVLALLVDKTQAGGSLSGQEERDHYFGQLFGIECFVRSGVLSVDASRRDEVLNLLLKLGNKKISLRPQCGWVLVQTLEQMSQSEVKLTLAKVEAAGLAKTPEGAAAWIIARNRYPELKAKPWRDPLSTESLGDLAAVLQESVKPSAVDADGTLQSQGGGKQFSWSAQLHFVWDVILGCFVKEGEERGGFDKFWTRVVDDGLFSKTATEGQKFKGFMVFQKFLQGLVGQDRKIRGLFSKNFITCLMNQAAQKDRYLHRAATKALKTIEDVVSAHTELLIPILENLLEKNGAYNFEQRTGTKTMDKLLQSINGQNVSGALTVIRRPMASLEQQSDKEATGTLRLYADYLSKVLNAFAPDAPDPSFASDASAQLLSDERKDNSKGSSLGPVLQELSTLAYAQPAGISSRVLTDQLRQHCRSRIESSLARLTRRADDFKLFCTAVASIDTSSRTMTGEIREAIDKALTRMKKLLKRKTGSDDEKAVARGLALLHAVSIFQLYNENSDAMEVLQDLAQFSDRLKAGGSANGVTEGSPELLVEILLSMVARPSSLMRQISPQVFGAFTGQMSAEAVALLINPLASDENLKGEKELFNVGEEGEAEFDENDSSSDEEGSEAGSDVDMDSDVEFVGLDAADDAADDGDDSDTSDDAKNDDDDDDDDDDNQGQNSRDKGEGKDGAAAADENVDELVGQILNSHRLDLDGDASESSSDGDMTDSEMLALDEKLAEVFRQQKQAQSKNGHGSNNNKQQRKEAKQTVVNFKHRVLDLVHVYVSKEALNPRGLAMLVPLLRLARSTSDKAIANRACQLLHHYQERRKKARTENRRMGKEEEDDDDDDDGNSNNKIRIFSRRSRGSSLCSSNSEYEDQEMLILLLDIHAEAAKYESHAYAKAASAASLIVASAMVAVDERDGKIRASQVYAESWVRMVLGDAPQLQDSFFADWKNWCRNYVGRSEGG